MAFSLEAAGAGASQGLDEYLQRMLLEQQTNQKGAAQQEDVRHNQASEALTGRQLDIMGGDKMAAEEERRAKVAAAGQASADEVVRKQREDTLLADPSTDPLIKKFIELRRITPKGETVPPEVLGVKKGNEPQHHPVTLDIPGVGDSLPGAMDLGTGQIFYQGKDITAQKPKVHQQPPGVQILPTDAGFVRAPRNGGPASPVTDASGAAVMPQSPGQIRTRVATSQKVEQLIPDIESEGDAVNAMGLMGPIGGRWADFAAGKWGSAGDLKAIGYNLTPEQEQTLNEFRTDLGFLKSGTAMVHGGARGGGSAQIMARMDQLINANKMDYNGFKGSLKSFKKLLSKYSSYTKDEPLDETSPAGAGGAGDLKVGGSFNGGTIRSITPVP